MCLKTFFDSLFSKPSTTQETGNSGTTIVINDGTTTINEDDGETIIADYEPQTVLPHPSEPIIDTPVDDVDIYAVVEKALADWDVLAEYRGYWHSVPIQITEACAAAAACSEIPYMWCNPDYANPGTIMHEFGHISYCHLTEEQKTEFETLVNAMLEDETQDWVDYLWSVCDYAHVSIVECHAEIWRYLGRAMPDALKQYYPRLF